MLVHQDAEIVDPEFIPKIREALAADPDVAIVGCAGAVGVRSIAWWEGVGHLGLLHPPLRGARRRRDPGPDLDPAEPPAYAHARRGRLGRRLRHGFSPWAIQNLRFDESLGGALHGYDFDICLQARAAGKKVVTGRPQGRPPPLARADQRRRRAGSTRTWSSPRSGTGGSPGRRGLIGGRRPAGARPTVGGRGRRVSRRGRVLAS